MAKKGKQARINAAVKRAIAMQNGQNPQGKRRGRGRRRGGRRLPSAQREGNYLMQTAQPGFSMKPGGITIADSVKSKHKGRVADVCQVTNPFCDAAFGSKWPDGSGSPTIPFSYHYISNGTQTAANAVGFFFMADWAYGFSSATAAAGVITVVAPSAHTSAITYSSVGQQGRVVSAGVICRVTSTASGSAGYIIGRQLMNVKSGDTLTANLISGSPGQQVMSITPGAEMAIIMKPFGPGAHDFHAALDGQSNANTPDWTFAYFEISANAAVSTVTFEVFVHCEILPIDTSAYGAVASKMPSKPAVVQASRKVHETGSGIHQTLQGNLTQAVDTAVTSLASQAVAGFMADPAGWGEAALALLF